MSGFLRRIGLKNPKKKKKAPPPSTPPEATESSSSARASSPAAPQDTGPSHPLLPPPSHDGPLTPHFSFWVFVVKDGKIAAGMRNAGLYGVSPGGEVLPVQSAAASKDPDADPGMPPPGGYRYDGGLACVDGGKYGSWVSLSETCKETLLQKYKDSASIDRKEEARRNTKPKVSLRKSAQLAPTPGLPSAFGGPSTRLPISISDYKYVNAVQNRLPLGVERGFQIQASLTSDPEDASKTEWSGKVPHLAGQVFTWSSLHPECVRVRFTSMKDWSTWLTDIADVPGVVNREGGIEVPTTHLWCDFDQYQFAFFYGDKCVARKDIAIPGFLRGPVDLAINWGLQKLENGESTEVESG
jgi:hypothetical protein